MKNRITALLALVAMAGQAQETTGRVMLTDSIAIRTDSLCQRNDICNHDTIRKDSCQQHRLSFVRKEQRPVWSISPNAVKMQKFDPYRKKFTDMRIMETIGSHICCKNAEVRSIQKEIYRYADNGNYRLAHKQIS